MSSKIVLIIQREFNQRVRKRSFILTTILMPLLLVGVMAIPVLIAVYGSSPSVVRQIVVVDSSGVVAPALVDSPSLSFTPTTLSCDSARRAAEYGEAFGFLTVGPRVVEDPSQVALYTRENSTRAIEDEIREQIRRIVYQQRIERADIPGLDSILQQLQVRPLLATYRIDEQAAGGDTARQSSSDLLEALSFGMGIIIYMFIFIYGAAIMHGVIEEKNNRIVEVIVSSVRPFQLMMGKIVGMTLVALTQFAIWAILVGGAFVVLRGAIPADGGAMSDGLLAAFSVFNASTILSVGGTVPALFCRWVHALCFDVRRGGQCGRKRTGCPAAPNARHHSAGAGFPGADDGDARSDQRRRLLVQHHSFYLAHCDDRPAALRRAVVGDGALSRVALCHVPVGGVAGGPNLPHRNLYVREKADSRRNFALDTLQRVKYVSKGVASGLET